MTGIFMIGARRATQRALEDIARGKNGNDDQMRLLLHCSNPFIHQYPGSYGEESSLELSTNLREDFTITPVPYDHRVSDPISHLLTIG